jgi:hypothetical protein
MKAIFKPVSTGNHTSSTPIKCRFSHKGQRKQSNECQKHNEDGHYLLASRPASISRVIFLTENTGRFGLLTAFISSGVAPLLRLVA